MLHHIIEVVGGPQGGDAGDVADHSGWESVPFNEVRARMKTTKYLQGGLWINIIQANVEIFKVVLCFRIYLVESSRLAKTKDHG